MGNKLLKGEKRKEKKKPKDILGYPKFMSRKKTKKATQLQMQACPKKKGRSLIKTYGKTVAGSRKRKIVLGK
jgi:hypothetical protein